MKNIRGISLIVLVITIIVVIILAGAVILSLSQNNPIETANKAKFLSDVNTFQTELELYKTDEYAKSTGDYNPTLLDADSSTATYNNVKIYEDATIASIMTSMKGDYLNKFEVKNGLLVLTSGTEDEKRWAEEHGVIVLGSLPKVIISVDKDRVAPGTQVNYTLNFVTPEENNTINIEESIKLVNGEEQEISGILNISQSDEVVSVIVNTTSLIDGTYTLRVSEGVITSSTGLKSEAKELSFIIDTSRPENPSISLNTTNPAREVQVTIDYYTATVKQYAITASIDVIPQDSEYLTYSGPFTIQANGVIWAKSKNAVGIENETVSTLEITNIDRTEPGQAQINPTASGSTITATITLEDSNGQLDLTQSKYKFAEDSDIYTVEDSRWSGSTTISTNPITVTEEKIDGDYYLHVLSVDRAGNKKSTTSSKITVSSKTVEQIAAGFIGTTYAIFSDGTVKAWGNNTYGQVGIGSKDNTKILLPVQVTGLVDGVKQIASGNGHTLFLLNNGTVMAVGRNDYGQLGDNSVVDKYTPVLVQNLSNVKQIGAGEMSSVALLNDGRVMTWGYNGWGSLGDGTTVSKSIPVMVPGLTGVQQISLGTGHVLALMQDGTLKGWGYNIYGQMGSGSQSNVSTPMTLSNFSNNIRTMAATARGTFVVYNNDTVKACGENNKNEIGDGTTTWRGTPVTVSGFTNSIKYIVYSSNSNTALLNDGTVMAWGNSSYGILGDGTTASKSRPTLLPNLSGVKQLVQTSNSTIVLLNDGTVKGFGHNAYGQLGNNSTTNTSTWVTTQGLLD